MFFVLALFLWQGLFELTRIDIEGLSRFKPAAVLTTLGLKTGGKAGKPEFDAACQKLIDSGLFQSCNWKFVPGSGTGISLTLQLREAPAPQKVRLSLAGVDEKQLWEWLRANEPLVETQMPESDEAMQFYTRAIQRYLKKEVTPSTETNLETKENTLIFRPANVGTVQSIQFSGASAIQPAVLEKALSTMTSNTPATEYDIRQLVDLNIRPMFENLGHLNVQFPTIRIDNNRAVVEVQEGPVYTLAKAQATGGNNASPKFAIGQRAEWNKVTTAAEEVAVDLRNKGYLSARYKIDRKLDNDAKTADISVTYTPGQQFTFETLKLEGLNTPQEHNIRALWKLPTGAPMNEGYLPEFLRAAFEKLGPEYSGVSHQLEPASDTAVNVIVRFSRK